MLKTNPAMVIFGVLTWIADVHSQERDLIILPREVKSCTSDVVQPWNPLRNVTLIKDAESFQTKISGVFQIEEPITEKTIIHLDIQKCLSAEQSSCYKFISLDDTNFCNDVGNPDKMWVPLLKYVETMEPKCPIPAGSYKLVEVPFTEVLVGKVDCIPGFWRMVVTLKEGDRTLGCVLGYGQIKQQRRSKKKTS